MDESEKTEKDSISRWQGPYPGGPHSTLIPSSYPPSPRFRAAASFPALGAFLIRGCHDSKERCKPSSMTSDDSYKHLLPGRPVTSSHVWRQTLVPYK